MERCALCNVELDNEKYPGNGFVSGHVCKDCYNIVLSANLGDNLKVENEVIVPDNFFNWTKEQRDFYEKKMKNILNKEGA